MVARRGARRAGPKTCLTNEPGRLALVHRSTPCLHCSLILFLSLAPQPGYLVGSVGDASTGVPLAGASVVICDSRIGAATDDQGRFRLGPFVPGEYRLCASHVGYSPETTVARLDGQEAGEIRFRLVPVLTPVPEVAVSARPRRQAEPAPTRVVTGEELRYRAGGFVQDAIRTLAQLPGVAPSARGEWSGSYVVRGGDPDESKVYFGGTELLWPYHLLGFSSVVNSDVVGDMEFHPSVFPVRYGGALSSVTVIRPKRPPGGEGSFAYDPMNLKAAYVGSLDDIDFLASVRRSFYFVQFGPMGSGRDNRPSFSDYALRAGVPLGRGYRLSAGAVSGVDHITTDLRGVYTDMSESGLAADIGVEAEVEGVAAELALFHGRHDFALEPAEWGGRAGTGQQESGVRLDMSTSPAGWLDAGWGVRATRVGFRGNLLEPSGFERADQLGEAYVLARLRPARRTTVDLGIRYDDLPWVVDRAVEPMFGFSWHATSRLVLAAGYRRVHQHPYAFLMQSGASVVFDDDYEGYETFRTGALRAKRADHYSVSGDLRLGGQMSLSVEGYLKDYSHLPTWQQDSAGTRSGYGNAGIGFARGVEVVLDREQSQGWDGWLSYGLAWSRKRQGDDTLLYWDRYDRRHAIGLSVQKRFRGDWTWSTTFRLQTGTPYTPLLYTHDRRGVGTRDLQRDGGGYTIEGVKNSRRVPVYHRLDFRLQKDLPHLPLKPFLYVEVLNFYNRENVYYLVEFETSRGDIATGRFSGIQFIPLFGIGGRF